MGMDPEASKSAARACKSVDEAVEWILDGQSANLAHSFEEVVESPPVIATVEDIEKENDEPITTVTVLTYNVWFEDIALKERMTEICRLIDSKKPDFVALQEVTPEIAYFLRSDPRLKTYCWSNPPPGAPYFTMLLSKRKGGFQRLAFPGSQQGRDLLCAEGNMGFGQKISVATSHLESALPPYHGPAMNDQARRDQMKMASELMTQTNKDRNIIFMGDMNWDDKGKEGPALAAIGEGWGDAWLTLKPAKDLGCTYNGKLNPMLLNYLQKRLDRIFFKLKDFAPSHIEMLGQSPIPGVTYEKQTKKGPKTLPVVASDHFGLYCEFQSCAAGGWAGRRLG